MHDCSYMKCFCWFTWRNLLFICVAVSRPADSLPASLPGCSFSAVQPRSCRTLYLLVEVSTFRFRGTAFVRSGKLYRPLGCNILLLFVFLVAECGSWFCAWKVVFPLRNSIRAVYFTNYEFMHASSFSALFGTGLSTWHVNFFCVHAFACLLMGTLCTEVVFWNDVWRIKHFSSVVYTKNV